MLKYTYISTFLLELTHDSYAPTAATGNWGQGEQGGRGNWQLKNEKTEVWEKMRLIQNPRENLFKYMKRRLV